MVEIACFLIVIVPAVLFGYALRAVLFDRPQPQPQTVYVPRHAKQDQAPTTVLRPDIRATVKVFGDTDTSRFSQDLLVGSAA